jgi:hypothetical protein
MAEFLNPVFLASVTCDVHGASLRAYGYEWEQRWRVFHEY